LSLCLLLFLVAGPGFEPTVFGTGLRLSDSKIIILGIAIGYPGWDAPVKQFRSERGPV
jgi:hypothetical protein